MSKEFIIGYWRNKSLSYQDGGAHAYSVIIERILSKRKFDHVSLISIGYDNGSEIHLKPFHENTVLRIINSLLLRIPFLKKLSETLKNNYDNKQMALLREKGIQLIYYPAPGVLFPDFPHIMTHWDNGHISTYPFPEVSSHGNLEARHIHFDIALNKAIIIICESEAGKRELLNFYPVNSNRVEVLAMPAGEIVEKEISSKPVTQLQGQAFFIYPAKYWPHKNHYNLIQAFSIFHKKNPTVKLVFTGFNQHDPTYIESCISEACLTDSVIQLGVVSVEELKWLYQNSLALVMPTLLGPTNMPLKEAMFLGCKVICTDLEGHREQLGDYALYFDALDKADIAAKMEMVYTSPSKTPPVPVIPQNDEIANSLDRIFTKSKAIRRTWGMQSTDHLK